MANGEANDDTGRGEKPQSGTQISLKQAIVRAAIELGTELGEEGLTMRGIAARLGVSATALYQHFEGKASILQAIRFHGLTLLNRELEPAFAPENPIERLRQCALTYIRFARSNPWLYGLLFEGEDIDYTAYTEQEREVMGSSTISTRTAFVQAKEAGLVHPDLDVENAPYLMWASNHGMSMLLITGRLSDKHASYPIPDIDKFIESFVETEIRGFTAAG